MCVCVFRFFKECPHPDDKQRKDLSRALGLEPLQIKFWFQNKRTQMKVNYSDEVLVLLIIYLFTKYDIHLLFIYDNTYTCIINMS